ncbi:MULTISPECIES: B12-binding domain-containing radical SAM protein [unclassified Saccharicrinis]|uniref:B12-binding domain-containing radical SAM protein n=1 Tax=unclassified Saccharicrinis TaxID=2646859 RepID=UPI003D353332
MPKILFIQPTQYSAKNKKPCKQKRVYLPGLAFPLLASITPKHWDVEVIIDIVEDVNLDTDADIVGIGAMGHAIFRAIDLAKAFKAKGKTVVMGGYMPSMVPWFVKDYCDSVVIGDAEIAYPKLLKDYELNGTIDEVYDYPIKELKNLPLPDYDILINKKIGYMLPVQAGRGCPNLCSYCSIACLYKGKYITRPIDEVMNDIYRVKELGFKRFYLIDDNIAGNPTYLEKLCQKIKPLRMTWASQCSIQLAKKPELLKLVAESGCRILSLGIESLSQEGLDKLNKKWVITHEHEELLGRIADAGILPATEMIIGTDGDTVQSIKATFEFIMKTKIPVPKFYIMTPMPGSDLYAEYKEQGRLIHENYSRYTATNCVHVPEKITPEKLENRYWWLYNKVYTIPNILKRTIFHKRFFNRPFMYLFAFVVNLHYRRYIKNGDAPNIF